MAPAAKWHRHLGVYAVTAEDPRGLLVIRKTRGPYSGLFDLAGGSLYDEESLAQALHRELREETGYAGRITGSFGVHEFLVRADHAGTGYTHHIAIFFKVALEGAVGGIGETVSHRGVQEANDSAGCTFLRADDDLDLARCSPLVKRCLDVARGVSYPSDLVRI